MKTSIFGYTESQLPIKAYQFGNQGPHLLIMGGVHGNEPEGVAAAEGLLGQLLQKGAPSNLQITIVPCLNLDGLLLKKRQNKNGVDLNRNLPTKDWSPHASQEKYYPGREPLSESENKALVRFIEAEKPVFILSLHSFSDFMLLDNKGLCTEECQLLASLTGYKIKNEIGYPTPGSLGTYGAFERDLPTLTYELERDMNFSDIQTIHVPALYKLIEFKSKQ